MERYEQKGGRNGPARLLFGARRYVVSALLIAVLLIAVTTRFYKNTENPAGFFTDEAAIGYNAYLILHTGRDEYGEMMPLMFRSYEDYKLGVFVYSVVPFVAVFGLTEVAVRAAGGAWGVLAVLMLYLLVAELFRNRWAGLAAELFLAVTPWHIHFSRTGFGEMLSFVPLYLLGVYLFVRAARATRTNNSGPTLAPQEDVKGRLKHLTAWLPWLCVGLAFGLSLYTYRSAWVTAPPTLIALGVIYRREVWAARGAVALGAGVLFLMALPIQYHLASGHGDRSQQVGILHLGLGTWETSRLFAEQYVSHFSYSFLFEQGDGGYILRHYLPGFGVLYRAQIPLMAVGALGVLFRPTREKAVIALLVLVFPLGAAMSEASPISSRAILGAAAASALSGYGLFLIAAAAGKLNPPYRHAAVAAVLAVAAIAMGLSVQSYLKLYHGEYRSISAGYWGWQSGPREIVRFFLDNRDKYDQLVMDGEFNAPDMFLRFYAPDVCVDETCLIGEMAYYDPARRQLFAIKPHNVGREFRFRLVREMHYPDGEPSFLLLEITGRR
ncbi:MAG: glycosyltransferase family 39 protein [SAR202 cluster bacterium]|nr:glycosyltransferase family 39 protein [SAR202 cluster bacterium]